MLGIINGDQVFAEFPDKYPPIFHDKDMKTGFETFGIEGSCLPTDNDPQAQEKYEVFLSKLEESYPPDKLKEHGFELVNLEFKV